MSMSFFWYKSWRNNARGWERVVRFLTGKRLKIMIYTNVLIAREKLVVSDNALKCIFIIYLYGRYLLITMLNLYNYAIICISSYYLSLHNFLNNMLFIVCNFLLSGNHVKKWVYRNLWENGGQIRIKEELKDHA